MFRRKSPLLSKYCGFMFLPEQEQLPHSELGWDVRIPAKTGAHSCRLKNTSSLGLFCPAELAGPKARSKLPVFRPTVISPLGVQYYSCASAPTGSVAFFFWPFSRCVFVSATVHLSGANLGLKSASNSAYFGGKMGTRKARFARG